MEKWKAIKGYEGIYEVSDFGNVKTVERVVIYSENSNSNTTWHTVKEKLKAQNDNGKGYKTVNLWKNNKGKAFYVHRLVAETFIPNPDNKETVNHKNFDKNDNRASNLEWHTYKENNMHSFKKTGRKKQGKPIKIIAFNDTENIVIENLDKWSKENGHDRSSVYHCLSGKNISHHGFMFRYADSDQVRAEKKYRTGKPIRVTTPEGVVIDVKDGITKWCENRGLNPNGALRVARGERSHYKGYKFEYIK